MPGPPTRETQLDPATSCLLWQGPVNSKDRPITFNRGMSIQAPRFAFEKYHQIEIPQGMYLRAICGVKLCVNPHHYCFKAPRNAMEYAKVMPRAFRRSKKIAEQLVTEGKISLSWDVSDLVGLKSRPSDLKLLAEAADIPYFGALASYAELVRSSIRKMKHGVNARDERGL